ACDAQPQVLENRISAGHPPAGQETRAPSVPWRITVTTPLLTWPPALPTDCCKIPTPSLSEGLSDQQLYPGAAHHPGGIATQISQAGVLLQVRPLITLEGSQHSRLRALGRQLPGRSSPW